MGAWQIGVVGRRRPEGALELEVTKKKDQTVYWERWEISWVNYQGLRQEHHMYLWRGTQFISIEHDLTHVHVLVLYKNCRG